MRPPRSSEGFGLEGVAFAAAGSGGLGLAGAAVTAAGRRDMERTARTGVGTDATGGIAETIADAVTAGGGAAGAGSGGGLGATGNVAIGARAAAL